MAAVYNQYRELTVDEYKRVERLYAEGYTKHEELLRAIMAEDMEMSYQEFVNYENPDIAMGAKRQGSKYINDIFV